MWMAKKGLGHLGSPKSPASPVSPSSSAAKSPSDAQIDIQSPVQSVAQTPAKSPDAQVDQPVDNGIDNLMEKLEDQGLEEKLESYRKRGDYGYKDENRSLKTAELYIRMIASLVFIVCALAFLCLGCVMASKAKKNKIIIRQPAVVIPKDEKPKEADFPPGYEVMAAAE